MRLYPIVASRAAGTYTVEAYLVATVVDIGKETLVTSATLTVTK